MIETMFSTTQASKALACSTRTIYRMIKRGEQSSGREGLSPITKRESGVILIPESTISKYLDRLKCIN